jgi:hypothetical protein
MPYNDEIDMPRLPWGKIALIFFVLIVIGLALDWVYAGQNFFLYQYWALKQADVQREVYTHGQSYRQGNVQRLDTLCIQLADADDDHKSMLRAVVAHEFAEWNAEDVPQHLRGCLADARAKH